MQYRRNINCLTSNQLHDLREAFAILYTLPSTSPHSYLHLAGLHGVPGNYCIHGAPGFFTWHRAYLLAVEEALHCLNPDVMVPFWNWSSGPTTGVPAACSSPTYVNRSGVTVPNPLYSGPLPAGGPGTSTSRGPSINTTVFDDLATTAQTAMTNIDFASFQSALNGVHGSVHVRVGGNMGSVPYAAYDPIFYMHHANCDRLWANWQATHGTAVPPDEEVFNLNPFVKPCTTGLYVGADMESTDALGYRYLAFCLIKIRPIPFKPFPLKVEPWMRQKLDAAKVVLRNAEMPDRSLELRVFINQPDADIRSKLEGNPRFAGSLGVFGMGAMSKHAKGHGAMRGMPPMPAKEGMFELELDITAALRRALDEKASPTMTVVPVGEAGKAVAARDVTLEGFELQVQ